MSPDSGLADRALLGAPSGLALPRTPQSGALNPSKCVKGGPFPPLCLPPHLARVASRRLKEGGLRGALGATRPVAEPLLLPPRSHYPPITSDGARQEYKQDFDSDLKRYKQLCAQMDGINDQINQLSRQLDQLPEGTLQYQVGTNRREPREAGPAVAKGSSRWGGIQDIPSGPPRGCPMSLSAEWGCQACPPFHGLLVYPTEALRLLLHQLQAEGGHARGQLCLGHTGLPPLCPASPPAPLPSPGRPSLPAGAGGHFKSPLGCPRLPTEFPALL